MQPLKKALQSTPLVYVTRDLERATGLVKAYKGLHIITNNGPFAKEYSKTHKNVTLIKAKEKLDTRELLAHPTSRTFLGGLKNPQIVVFKNTKQIERICSEQGWPLLNPSAELASYVEEKISQLHWLGSLQNYLPPHHIQLCEDLLWSGEPYIVQFNHAHTGLGTILITAAEPVNELKEKFPHREVRITQYIKGPAFTSNNVVWGKKVFVGNINYQITGLSPFTTNPFATVGNDWALPSKILSAKQVRYYKQMVTDIGKKLAQDGWKGLFGVDTILDEQTGKIYLIEINARQPAGTTFESTLQKTNTTFEAHLSALLSLPATKATMKAIKNGAQIIKRVPETGRTNTTTLVKKLKNNKLQVITYDNDTPGSDWLRIQSNKGIMSAHDQLNVQGEKIAELLKD